MEQSAIQFNLEQNLCQPHQLKKKPKSEDEIPFGKLRTDHMFNCEYAPDEKAWVTGKIEPLRNFVFTADSMVFHYGQQVFEGLKAYRSTRDPSVIQLFRPELNAKRFYRSAELLGMEPVPEELFFLAIRELLKVEVDWILPAPNSLYIRPLLIPLDEGVYARRSRAYRFSVLLSPVQEYFTGGKGVLLAVDRERTRACPGGVGEAKCGGNYAASMYSLEQAKIKGADQVLFLDGAHHKYIEEASAMNVFFVYENELRTPSLSGSILRGVTRNSIIELARLRGLRVREEKIEIDQVISDIKEGKLSECFLCGTAAVITPVRGFLDRGNEFSIGSQGGGEVALSLRKELVAVQSGSKDGPNGWIVRVN